MLVVDLDKEKTLYPQLSIAGYWVVGECDCLPWCLMQQVFIHPFKIASLDNRQWSLCRQLIRIPMQRIADSLTLAVAGSVNVVRNYCALNESARLDCHCICELTLSRIFSSAVLSD
jgi:hypothetical protein